MANKENTIPGIEGYDTAGLSDGRAKSSAFQLEQEDESVEAGKELLKEEAMESMEEDNAGVGGSALAMAVTSPVQQEEKTGVLGGQEIAKMSIDETGGYSLDEENGKLMTTDQFGGKEGILINDPNDVLEGSSLGNDDFKYKYKIEEDGSYTLLSKGPEESVKSPEEKSPEGPPGPGGMDIKAGEEK